jgi:hypothetical protein
MAIIKTMAYMMILIIIELFTEARSLLGKTVGGWW